MLSILVMSCNFMSCNFMCCIFMSCNFMSCNFDGPSFSCPSFSAPPRDYRDAVVVTGTCGSGRLLKIKCFDNDRQLLRIAFFLIFTALPSRSWVFHGCFSAEKKTISLLLLFYFIIIRYTRNLLLTGVQVYRVVWLMWTVSGHRGQAGQYVVRLVRVALLGDIAHVQLRPHKALAMTAPGLLMILDHATNSHVLVNGLAGHRPLHARSHVAQVVPGSALGPVSEYLASQSVAMETTLRRYLVRIHWCCVQDQVRLFRCC